MTCHISTTFHDGSMARKARDFWSQLALEVFAAQDRFLDGYLDIPLWYDESVCSSTFLSGLSRVTPVHLAELPCSRSKRQGRGWSRIGHGRVDYWAYYRDVDFLIELKHQRVTAMYPANGDDAHLGSVSDLRAKWSTMQTQLRQIEHDVRHWDATGKHQAVGLGVMIVALQTGRPPHEWREGQDATLAEELFGVLTEDGANAFAWQGLPPHVRDLERKTTGDSYPLIALIGAVEFLRNDA